MKLRHIYSIGMTRLTVRFKRDSFQNYSHILMRGGGDIVVMSNVYTEAMKSCLRNLWGSAHFFYSERFSRILVARVIYVRLSEIHWVCVCVCTCCQVQ